MAILQRILYYIGTKLVLAADGHDRSPIYEPESEVGYACGVEAVASLMQKDILCISEVYIWGDTDQESCFNDILRKAGNAKIPVAHAKDFVPGNYFRAGRLSISASFKKWEDHIRPGNHMLLDHLTNPDNIGSIIHSALYFGISDIAVIDEKRNDTFNPLMIISSCGARFGVRMEVFSSISEYRLRFQENHIYAFVLDESANGLFEAGIKEPYTLAFGNESFGLPAEYREFSQNVFIAQSEEVDSLNVGVAAAISLWAITHKLK